MKKQIAFLILLSGMSQAQTFVLGTRIDLGRFVPQAIMLKSIYTNGLVLWSNAYAGTRNDGATNFFIPDLSTNGFNAIQPITNMQPSVIWTNGLLAYRTDGVDDFIYEPVLRTNVLAGFSLTVLVTNDVPPLTPLKWIATITTNQADTIILGAGYSSATNCTFMLGEGGKGCYITNTILAGVRTLGARWDGVRYQLSVDGVDINTFCYGIPSKYLSHQLHFGKRGTSGANYPMSIYEVSIYEK